PRRWAPPTLRDGLRPSCGGGDRMRPGAVSGSRARAVHPRDRQRGGAAGGRRRGRRGPDADPGARTTPAFAPLGWRPDRRGHPEVGTRPVMMTDRPPVGGRPFAGRVLVVCGIAAEPHVGAQLVALGVAGEAILPIRDVEEAVRTIEGSMPAIAIVDLDVAERTGADAVRRLREAAPRLPLLVLASTEAMASDGLKAGADD